MIRMDRESPPMNFPSQSPWIIYLGSKSIAEAFEIYRICGIGRASGKFLLLEGPRQSWLIRMVESSLSRTVVHLERYYEPNEAGR